MEKSLVGKVLIFLVIGFFLGTGFASILGVSEGNNISPLHIGDLTITSPYSGQVVSGIIYISWIDNTFYADIYSVYYKIYCRNQCVATNLLYPHSSFSWNSRSLTDGSCTIRVQAIMVDLNDGTEIPGPSDSVQVIVKNIDDPPVACYSCSDFTPDLGQMVSFDGSCSSDPDGHIVHYSWSYTVDGGVPVDMDSGKIVSYSWSTPGSYMVSLEVTDNNGASDQETKAIMINGGDADLDCSGSLVWSSVEPSDRVSGSFTVRNIGDACSGLDWKVESYPSWGNNWYFSPDSGTGLTPGDGPVTVQVSVDAPNVEEASFSGQVLVVNSDDGSDYETISVFLSTPQNKITTNPFLHFLKNHPHLFPVLRQILLFLG